MRRVCENLYYSIKLPVNAVKSLQHSRNMYTTITNMQPPIIARGREARLRI